MKQYYQSNLWEASPKLCKELTFKVNITLNTP